MLDFVIISGPTAVGKTQFVEDLAVKKNAEIISADSQAVYKYLDIGTAKPGSNDNIKYHLIDVVDPDKNYDVSNFISDVEDAVKRIRNKNKKILISGGTPMYINKLIYGLTDAPGKDEEIRSKLKKEAEKKGKDFLYEKLKKIDPVSAENIHENDLYRIIRALEIYEITGKTRTFWHKKTPEPRYNFLYFILNRDRKKLYTRINKRVDKMIQEGLVEEVMDLIEEKNYTGNEYGFNAIGYREVVDYLNGKIDKDEMVRLIKRNTRRFAKRQLIWFRKEEGTVEYNLSKVDESLVLNDIIEKIKKRGGLK